jgi:hypothetical protein
MIRNRSFVVLAALTLLSCCESESMAVLVEAPEQTSNFAASFESADADVLKLWDLLETPAEAARFDYCNSTQEDRSNKRLRDMLSERLGPNGRRNGAKRAAAILVEAGVTIADSNSSVAACRGALREGSDLFQETFAEHLDEMQKQADPSSFSGDELGSVKQNIANAWAEDQGSRLTYIELLNPIEIGSSDYWAFERAKANAVHLDWEHRMLIRDLLDRFEWIDHQTFGAPTAERAITLVQHADADPMFQRLALKRMENHLGPDGVSPVAYANLWDRVAINSGKRQRYGTQPQAKCDAERQLNPMPIENVEGLPELRKAMGLEPLDEQMERLSRERCS